MANNSVASKKRKEMTGGSNFDTEAKRKAITATPGATAPTHTPSPLIDTSLSISSPVVPPPSPPNVLTRFFNWLLPSSPSIPAPSNANSHSNPPSNPPLTGFDALVTGQYAFQDLMHTGGNFGSEIKKVIGHKKASVGRELTIGGKPQSFSFSMESQFRPTQKKTWWQGYMKPLKDSEYQKIVPNKISLNRTKSEVQAMRTLAKGDGYKPKAPAMHSGDYDGKIALQSYLEEMTGQGGLQILNIGSGMRAMLLATHLELKSGFEDAEDKARASSTPIPSTGKIKRPGFQKEMLDRFPQLQPGGATGQVDKIYDEQEKMKATGIFPPLPATATQQARLTDVQTAHSELDQQIEARFKKKLGWAQAGRLDKAGDWWKKNAAKVNDSTATASLQAEYRKRKLKRHGIADLKS